MRLRSAQGLVPPNEAAAMGLKERAAATMNAVNRVYRVGRRILPSTGRAGGPEGWRRHRGEAGTGAPRPAWRSCDGARRRTRRRNTFDARFAHPMIFQAVEQYP
jgi:hypothetical protein